jgi:septin family protein
MLLMHLYGSLGASGTGRTTFVNTLCDSNVLSKKVCDNPEEAHNEEGITIKPVSVGNIIHLYLYRNTTNLLIHN